MVVAVSVSADEREDGIGEGEIEEQGEEERNEYRLEIGLAMRVTFTSPMEVSGSPVAEFLACVASGRANFHMCGII